MASNNCLNITVESLLENIPEILPEIIKTNIFICIKVKKFCDFDLFECDVTYWTKIV